MNDLVAIKAESVPAIFSAGGLDPIVQKIKEEVSGHVPDLTTLKGRKEIASLAAKVARSKTYLDGLGKDLVSGIKAQSKVIDSERKAMRDTLDALKIEVRAPLTEWEEVEKKRVAEIEANIEAVSYVGAQFSTSSEVVYIGRLLALVDVSRDFGDNKEETTAVISRSIELLKARGAALLAEEDAVRREAEAEIIRIENERKEREARIAEEAAHAATAKAEAEAKAEAGRVEADARRKEADRQRVEAEKEAKAKAEADRVAREAKEKQDAADRAVLVAQLEKERAEKEAAQAVEHERQRVAAEVAAEGEAARKREANRKNRGAVNSAARDCLISAGLSEDDATAAVKAIASGRVHRVTISY